MKKKVKSVLNEDDALISELEKTGYEPIKNEDSEVLRYTTIFKESGAKIKRINIRMTMRDVEKAQAIALREGIPYATLLTNVLHQYLTGRLKRVDNLT